LSARPIPRYGARMLWLIVILLIGALSFVIFHKPHVNAMGAGWVPPEQRKPAQSDPRKLLAQASVNGAEDASAEDAVTGRVTKQEPVVDTFNFNDLFGGPKNQGPTDRPNA
jgi:hypothetical protein